MKRVVALLLLAFLAVKPMPADAPVLPTPVVYAVRREEGMA